MDINLVKNSLKSVGISIISALAMLLVLNLISYNTTDPDKMILPFSYTTLIISTFLCGLLAAKFSHEKKFLCSAISGAIYIFIIFILSLIFRGNDESATPAWLTFVMYILSFGSVMLGGAAGKQRKISSEKVRKNIKNKYSQNLRRKIQ